MGNKGAASGKASGGGARYREVNDDSIFDESVKDWRDQITSTERNTVKQYTGSLYEDLNDSLRTGDYLDEHTSEIKNLDSALGKFDLKENIVVYRGVGDYAFPGGTPEVGSIISDKAYMSTSVEKKVAQSFDNGYILKIQVPQGKGRGAYVRSISYYSHEYEFLMARDVKLKITGTAPGTSEGFKSNRTVVYATYTE